MALEDLISVAKGIDFGTLYIKPAFVFVDDSGNLKLQFEADTTSALAYLYDSLCKELGITWNYESPSNDLGVYSSCSMHSAGDRAAYGCGPDGSNTGGFCPQMTLAYSPRFQSEDLAASYLYTVNNYIDYYRSLYPSGVAVGTSKFCPDGGCLGLFLNRIDLYSVFKPDQGGSWVEYNGASMPPTFSPAPRYNLYYVFRPDQGGCGPKKKKKKIPGPAIYNSGNTNQNTIIRGNVNVNVNVNTFTRKNIPNPKPTPGPTRYPTYGDDRRRKNQ